MTTNFMLTRINNCHLVNERKKFLDIRFNLNCYTNMRTGFIGFSFYDDEQDY